MSKVERIEGHVKGLSSDELRSWRNWFAKFDAQVWDPQIEADGKSSALLSLAEHALAEHKAGRSTVL